MFKLNQVARNRSTTKVDSLRDGNAPIRQTAPDEFCVHILQGHSGFVLTICRGKIEKKKAVDD
jgi:hypothetical protein